MTQLEFNDQGTTESTPLFVLRSIREKERAQLLSFLRDNLGEDSMDDWRVEFWIEHLAVHPWEHIGQDLFEYVGDQHWFQRYQTACRHVYKGERREIYRRIGNPEKVEQDAKADAKLLPARQQADHYLRYLAACRDWPDIQHDMPEMATQLGAGEVRFLTREFNRR